METSLSFTTLICHTSTRLLIQETVLPALHSSRGVFNVFDRRLPATVIAGGFLSLGNKLAKNGRLEMDSEHMNNPNIALIFVSFFSFMAMMSETETFLKEASSILKQGSPKVAIQDHITSEKMNIQTKCLSLVVFHCLFLNQSRFSARARKNLWWVCKHSAMASQIVDTWWYIYIGLHGHTEILKNVISIHQVKLASWCGIPKVVRSSASSQAFCALSRSLRLKGYWILSQGWSPISTCLELKL